MYVIMVRYLYSPTGLVYPLREDNINIMQETNVTLSVAVNPIAKVFYNLRGLMWFHDGNQLVSGERVEITEDQTEVTIINLSKEDSGVYEARFTGLRVQPHVLHCEAAVLGLLSHYPILRAAVFHITSDQEGMFVFQPHIIYSLLYAC